MRSRARHTTKSLVRRLFRTPPREPLYPRLQWSKARWRALAHRRGVLRGMRVEWDRPMHAWVVPFDLAGPGPGEVLIRTEYSAISAGTERAFFSMLPNTRTTYPFYPGSGSSGIVLEVGRSVRGFAPGDRVAMFASHASVVTRQAPRVVPVPASVSLRYAAFTGLGVTALQGVQRSGPLNGRHVAVLGRGMVGHLTAQLAHAEGARVTSLALSSNHVTASLRAATECIVATHEEPAQNLEGLEADVVVVATGAPDAVADAARRVALGGRIVILGSPRGATELDLSRLAEREVLLVGSHVETLADHGDGSAQRRFGEGFLARVADGSVVLDDLVGDDLHPWDVGHHYRALAERDDPDQGAVIRWGDLPDERRSLRVGFFAPPDMEALHRTAPQRAGSNGATKTAPAVPEEASAANGPRPAAQRTMGLAVVGCGERGSLNARAARYARRVELRLVMDQQPASAKRLGDALRVPWTDDFERVLQDRSVDTIFLNTPHHLHAEQAVRAARAGKHLIVEKPLATRLEDAERMVASSREHGVRLATWLGMRYLPSLLRAKELVDAGLLGRVLGAHLRYHRKKPASYYQAGYSGAGSDWRSRWETSGGGVLVMNGVHYVDWLLHLTGLHVASVSARYATLDSPGEVEDTVALWGELDNGALLTADFASCVQGAQDDIVELRVWGRDGHLSLAPPEQYFATRRLGPQPTERWQRLEPLPKARHANQDLGLAITFLERYAAALRDDAPFEGSDGLELQAIVEAAYRSSRSGAAVSVASAPLQELT